MNPESLNVSDRDDFLHNTLYAYFRWKWAALAVFLLLIVLTFFGGYLMTPTWQAEVHLLAEPTLAPASPAFPDPTRPKPQQESKIYAEHMMKVLTGKEMALAVVREFGLDERLRRRIEEPGTFRDVFISGCLKALEATITTIKSLFTDDEKTPTDWADEAAEKFRDGLFATMSAELVEETDIVELTVNGETPELANAISAFMITHARVQLAAMTADAGKGAVSAYRVELENVIRRQQETERKWADLIAQNKGVDPAEIASLRTEELSRLRSDRARLLAEKTELETLLTEARSGSAAAGHPLAVSARMRDDSVIQQLRANLNAQRVALGALLQEVTESHPDAMNARAQIEQTESALAAEIERSLRDISLELRTRTDEMTALENELSDLSAREVELAAVRASLETTRALRRSFESHVESLSVTSESGVPALTVKVLDHAKVSPAKNPDSPMWLLVAIIALFFASGSAVVLPPFIEYWRDPIRGPADLEARGLTPLAVTPAPPHKLRARLSAWVASKRPPRDAEPPRTSPWHDVAARLMAQPPDSGSPACFLVTSGERGEGRTTACHGIAGQLAAMGRKVAVIAIGTPEPAGAVSLAGRTEPIDYVRPAGSEFPVWSIPESFGSLPSWSRAPAGWATGVDLLLIDAPPLGSFIRKHLTPQVDGVILVLEPGRHRLAYAVRAARCVTEGGGRLLGIIMNRHRSPLPRWLDFWGDRP